MQWCRRTSVHSLVNSLFRNAMESSSSTFVGVFLWYFAGPRPFLLGCSALGVGVGELDISPVDGHSTVGTTAP
jgi:hypothetical protein